MIFSFTESRLKMTRNAIFVGHSVKEDIIGRGQIFSDQLLGLRGMGICLIAGKFRKKSSNQHGLLSRAGSSKHSLKLN